MGCRLHEKKANGIMWPSVSCCRTTPTEAEDVFIDSRVCAVGSGLAKSGSCKISLLILVKALLASDAQMRGFLEILGMPISNACKCWNVSADRSESMAVIYNIKEFLEFECCRRPWEIQYSINFLWKWGDGMEGDPMSKVVNCKYTKHIFNRVNMQTIVLEVL